MEQERRDDQLSVADLVDDYAADDDAEAETGEPGAADGTELRPRETEFGRPVSKNAAPDSKTNAGREDGQEARPE